MHGRGTSSIWRTSVRYFLYGALIEAILLIFNAMYIFVDKLYSKHVMQILASPKACGFSMIDYDAMNPEEKNRVRHQQSRHTKTNTHKTPRTRGTHKILHTIDHQ